MPYGFDNLRLLDRPWKSIDHTVADQMSAYWTNFARSGDPNGAGLPQWEAHRPNEAATMRLGPETGRIPIADPAKVRFWKAVLESPRRPQSP